MEPRLSYGKQWLARKKRTGVNC